MASQGWSPLTAPTVSLQSTVNPDAITRNLSCSGDALAAITDTTTWTRVAKTTVGIAGGHEAATFSTDTDPNGSVIAYDDKPDAVGATESVGIESEDATGYLAAECGDAVNGQWLVGGSTLTGRDAVLTISNATSVEARIDLEFWGAKGVIDAPAAHGIIIPGGTQRTYSLAGFAPNESSPVVHVISNGAPVWATLQVAAVRGLVSGGLDRITPIAEPALHLDIPIIHSPAPEVLAPLLADPDFADTTTLIRFLVPGEKDASITLTMTPQDGSDPHDVTTTIPAGVAVDIPVDELAEGDYTLSVDSDQPIVSAVRVGFHDPTTGITDLAWASGIAAVAGDATGFVPAAGTLSIINPNSTDATVTVVHDGNVSTDVSVPANSYATLAVGRGAIHLSTTTTIASAIFIQTDTGIATIRIPFAPLGSRSVTVIAH